jgi:hypothetical protein
MIYLSGPIIHQNLRKDDFYHMVIDSLQSKGHDVFAPQFMPPAESEIIYKRDVDAVERCNVLLGEVSSPSLGVGMEIMLAIRLSKPIILFYNPSHGALSRMISGAPGVAIFEYSTIDEVRTIVDRLDLDHVQVDMLCPNCKTSVTEYTDTKKRCVVCGKELS